MNSRCSTWRSPRSRRRTCRVSGLGVEEELVLERNGELFFAAGFELRLERELGDDLGLAEPQVCELLVSEVLDDLHRGLPVRGVRLPVAELHVLRPEADNPVCAADPDS